MVAHRLSTIRHADVIVGLSDGRISEQGTHEQLVQVDGGVYRQLVSSQVGGHGVMQDNTRSDSSVYSIRSGSYTPCT